jgi:hypothetical protein
MRLLNLCVIIGLVAAAGYVYEIKFQATLDAERLARMRLEIRREREAIAALRAQWARLDSPGRIEGLARRHLQLQPFEARQATRLDDLPPRRSLLPEGDPIGTFIEDELLTSSIAGQPEVQ